MPAQTFMAVHVAILNLVMTLAKCKELLSLVGKCQDLMALVLGLHLFSMEQAIKTEA
jgi:hypothetical protein